MWSDASRGVVLPLARLALLGSVGLVMGAQSLVPVFPTLVEFVVWTAIALFLWAPLLARWAPGRPVLGGFVVGLFAGLATGGVQALFQSRFLSVWPEYAAQSVGRGALEVGASFVAFGVAAGAATGVIAGLVAWAIVSWRARRAPVVV